jgi:hypothetical protein
LVCFLLPLSSFVEFSSYAEILSHSQHSYYALDDEALIEWNDVRMVEESTCDSKDKGGDILMVWSDKCSCGDRLDQSHCRALLHFAW